MKRCGRHKSRTKLVILLLLSIEVLIIVSGLAYVQLRPMVVEAVTMEAGVSKLDVEEFLLYEKPKGSFITEIQELNLKNPGNYAIEIKVGNRVHTSNLQIIDSIMPTATVVDQMILKEEVIEAKAFVTDIKDATEVSVSFQKAPDTKLLGDQEVIIILEDSSHNLVEKKANLTVLDIKNSVSIEAGSIMDIKVADFVDNGKYKVSFETDLAKLDISKTTVHKILINVNGRTVSGNIEVIDTTPPTATIKDLEIWNDENPPAMLFVKDINDASGVKVTYKQTPDFKLLGNQEVTIILEDDFGNRTEQSAMLTVKADTQAPEIIGAVNKMVYIGESVSYRKGVIVKDNKEKDLTVSIESSSVNLKKEGIYTVYYSAQDKADNTAKATVTVTVRKFVISEDEVNTIADDILAKFVKPTMTKLEIANEIYLWVKQHVSYTGSSDKTDWLAEAYRGMKNGVGDCFTFYAVAQALLTRADIENMCVTRVGGRTQHFWNLVNCGDGWYHFDTCPNKDHRESFMLTDKEVEDYTKLRGNNYYSFDKSLYPATPDK
ncbi:MAG: transglutaminase domain-containing protein [Mobilitalea sp.]